MKKALLIVKYYQYNGQATYDNPIVASKEKAIKYILSKSLDFTERDIRLAIKENDFLYPVHTWGGDGFTIKEVTVL